MSQFVLCRGGKEEFICEGITVLTYPFNEELLNTAANYLWDKNVSKEVWTIIDSNSCEIDCRFTEAQRQMNKGSNFQTTRLNNLLNALIKAADEITLWYSQYFDDISTVTEKEEFLRIVEDGVKESCCEVYINYHKKI